jgi:UDP-N-acetylglucosamine 4,6-dehydratase (inverting)
LNVRPIVRYTGSATLSAGARRLVSMLNGKSILVTGGTGSFGKAFVVDVLARFPELRRVIVYSRDELKQFEMSRQREYADPRIRYFIGDVRDGDRLRRALEGVEMVVHAAALKQVPAAEYNPFEAVKTNIIGAQNVIEACLDQNVRRVVALSTDKAAGPINLYGATKLCSDKLFVAANNYKGPRDLRFSVVRYGNVLGSRGSVVPLFLRERERGVLPITDPRMTRFNITLKEGVELVLHALEKMWGGEIFVPKIPSYRITDVARAIGPRCRHEIVGIRPGEKLHEEMITAADSLTSSEFARHYVIMPSMSDWTPREYTQQHGGDPCKPGFAYNSSTNDRWLDVPALRRLVREHVDPTFSVEDD